MKTGGGCNGHEKQHLVDAVKHSDGDSYEDTRCLEQELTFDAAKMAFQRYGVAFSEEKYRALGLIRDDSVTSLALLLSEQCRHSTKIAVLAMSSVPNFGTAGRLVARCSGNWKAPWTI